MTNSSCKNALKTATPYYISMVRKGDAIITFTVPKVEKILPDRQGPT